MSVYRTTGPLVLIQRGDNFIFAVRTCSSVQLKSHFELLLRNGRY